MIWFGVVVASALLAVLSLVSPSVGAPLCQVIDLGTLAGTQSTAYGINAQGEVCVACPRFLFQPQCEGLAL